MQPPIKLVIVAADPLVRSSLAQLVDDETGCEVVYSTDPINLLTADLSDVYKQAGANLILWDMGWESGNLESLDFLDLDLPVVSLVADLNQAIESWNAGAKAILSREIGADELLAAVQAAVRGLLVFDPSQTSSLLPVPPRVPGDLLSTPTARELEVLQLLAEGLTNRAIANALDISEHTVKFHVNAILSKFEAQSRTEAVVTATRLGFIVL